MKRNEGFGLFQSAFLSGVKVLEYLEYLDVIGATPFQTSQARAYRGTTDLTPSHRAAS
jgi:hypothetical protein